MHYLVVLPWLTILLPVWIYFIYVFSTFRGYILITAFMPSFPLTKPLGISFACVLL